MTKQQTHAEIISHFELWIHDVDVNWVNGDLTNAEVDAEYAEAHAWRDEQLAALAKQEWQAYRDAMSIKSAA